MSAINVDRIRELLGNIADAQRQYLLKACVSFERDRKVSFS